MLESGRKEKVRKTENVRKKESARDSEKG